MKCHYEVLGVPKDASDDDLKKNYRKLALRWHPDKNLDNPDEAKEQFQTIQQAFEVLSDPQERAWYDAHREAILKGGIGSDFKDDSFDVFPFFTSSCYKGYGDDEKGFYSVYREVFNNIASEEADLYGEDSDSDFEIPSFGNSTSNYEEVVHAFYAFWQSFSTRKSYAWQDEYDTRQAENRRVVRAMEKENKKVREKARKERNEEVRALVAFVKKRDKRFEQHRIKLAERSKENAIKAENSRKRHLAERKKVLEEYKDPEYLNMENMEGVLKDIESQLAAEFGESCSGDDASNSEAEDVPCGLFCVACNKNFKTDKAFANHENSKRHKENVAALKVVMNEEEEQEQEFGDREVPDSLPDSIDEIYPSENEDLALSSEEEIVLPKKNKKNKKKAMVEVVADDSSDTGSVVSLAKVSMSKKQRRRKEAQAKAQLKPQDESLQDEPQDGPPDKPSAPTTAEGLGEVASLEQDEAASLEQEVLPPPAQKPKSRRAKVPKQAASKPAVEPSDAAAGVDTSHTCVKCSSSFKSRNKLFEHFKKTGHSVALSNAAPVRSVEKKKRK